MRMKMFRDFGYHAWIVLISFVFLWSPIRCSFTTGILERITMVTYTGCVEKCESRPACVHVVYTRRYNICELYSTISGVTDQVGTKQYHKAGGLIANRTSQCLECNNIADCIIELTSGAVTCQPSDCPTPEVMLHADLFGNMLTKGSEVKYVCQNNVHTDTIICQSDGTWSHTWLHPCLCSLSSDVLQSHVQIIEEPEGEYRAEYSCNDGYQLHQRSTPRCHVSSGNWSDIKYVCCDNIDQNWTKIYRYPAKFNKMGILSAYLNDDGSTIHESCFYRNSNVLDNWSNYDIQKVRVDIVKNEEIVAFMLFNGISTNKKSWFTHGKLLNSSWQDLISMTPTSNSPFDIKGVGPWNDYQGSIRFVVSEYVAKTGNCDNDVGWFAITRSYYPCQYTGNYGLPRILYAQYDRKSRFMTGELDFADRMDIWIQK